MSSKFEEQKSNLLKHTIIGKRVAEPFAQDQIKKPKLAFFVVWIFDEFIFVDLF